MNKKEIENVNWILDDRFTVSGKSLQYKEVLTAIYNAQQKLKGSLDFFFGTKLASTDNIADELKIELPTEDENRRLKIMIYSLEQINLVTRKKDHYGTRGYATSFVDFPSSRNKEIVDGK